MLLFILIILNPLPDYLKNKVAIIIPVFNDTHVLRQVVEKLLQHHPMRIIIVDDGSAIPVAEHVRDLPVVCLRHKVNLGQGAALQTGFSYALSLEAEIVVTFDADGQHATEDLPSIVQPIADDEVAVVLGSRFLEGSHSNASFSRRFVLKAGRFVNFLFCGILLSDAHNGLRAFSRKAIEQIVITENRMAHASEILFEIRRLKLSYKEIPVHIHYSDYSQQKGQSGWDGLKVLFDLALHKFFK